MVNYQTTPVTALSSASGRSTQPVKTPTSQGMLQATMTRWTVANPCSAVWRSYVYSL